MSGIAYFLLQTFPRSWLVSRRLYYNRFANGFNVRTLWPDSLPSFLKILILYAKIDRFEFCIICCVMFRRFGLLIFRNVFRNVTVRTALAFVAVLLLLRTLKYGSEYFMRVDRFYLKVCQFTCSIFYMHTYVNSFISNCTTKFQICC